MKSSKSLWLNFRTRQKLVAFSANIKPAPIQIFIHIEHTHMYIHSYVYVKTSIYIHTYMNITGIRKCPGQLPCVLTGFSGHLTFKLNHSVGEHSQNRQNNGKKFFFFSYMYLYVYGYV